VKERKTQVSKLKKELYGLKKAPKDSYAHNDSYLVKLRFTRSSVYTNLYYKVIQGMHLILV